MAKTKETKEEEIFRKKNLVRILEDSRNDLLRRLESIASTEKRLKDKISAKEAAINQLNYEIRFLEDE